MPKLALKRFQRHTPAMGIMQWFHFEDPRLDGAVARTRRRGVTRPRTGLGRSGNDRTGPKNRFDRRMKAFEEFDTTVAACFTPESEGIAPHHTSPPKDPMYAAYSCARMTERYAPAQQRKAVA